VHAEETEKETIQVGSDWAIQKPDIPVEHLPFGEGGGNVHFAAGVYCKAAQVAQVAYREAAQIMIRARRPPAVVRFQRAGGPDASREKY